MKKKMNKTVSGQVTRVLCNQHICYGLNLQDGPVGGATSSVNISLTLRSFF